MRNRLTISIDDGCASDVRAADLATTYGAHAVFYWPIEWRSLAYSKGYKPLSYLDALKISENHELGAHTVTHRHLTTLPYDELMTEIIDSKHMTEMLFGVKVTKFCPPRGYVNADSNEIVAEHFNFQRLTKGRGLVHIHPNSGANDNVYWTEAIGPDTREIWGHSWEIDKFDLWDELEEVLREHSYT